MPRLKHQLPRYRRHASGQALVEFGGAVHYLGSFDSPESRQQYDSLVGSWIAAGRPAKFDTRRTEPASTPIVVAIKAESKPMVPPPPGPAAGAGPVTVVQLIARFWKYAKTRYVKFGEPTGTHLDYRPCLRQLKALAGHLPVQQFGPLLLKQLRQQMIEAGQSRSYINDNLSRIRRVFRWGVSEEIVPVPVVQALDTVELVGVGASGVAPRKPVSSVSSETVEATLPFLSAVVADMVRLQRATGARPGEICLLRPVDVDRSGSPWSYRPQHHKTEHHEKPRLIYIGPRGQAILQPYLDRAHEAYCFSPAESQSQRLAMRQAKARLSRGANREKGTLRRRPPGQRFTNDSYRRAITRACDQAFPAPKDISAAKLVAWQRAHRWAPNQLRHAAASEICSQFPLLAAKITLGHSSVRTTEGYVDPNLEMARQVMEKLG